MKETVPHLGQQSTQLIREWCQHYQYFKEIAKIMKVVLEKHNLNKSFLGGLSSYMLNIIIASFFMKFGSQ